MSLIQNDIVAETAQETLEDLKLWHNLEAGLDVSTQRCESCGEYLEEKRVVMPDPVGTEYYDVCINPSCKEFGKDVV